MGDGGKHGGQHIAPSRGFTLVELVIVIVLAGIMALIAAPRFFQLSSFEARGFFDETLSAVRYAHKLAIASGSLVHVQVTGSTYTVQRWASCPDGAFSDIRNPATGETGYTGSAPDSVTITGSLVFYYDRVGQPRNALSCALAPQGSVDIGARRITVEPTTGFAHSG